MPINIVLYQPEIPQNTGNIMRTCVGTGCKLHLIKPLGFKLDPKYIKRNAANYLEHIDYLVYEDYQDFIQRNPSGRFIYLTRYGHKSPKEYDFSNQEENLFLIFGRESTGIPKEILSAQRENCLRLPANDLIRSLNLANTVAIMIYEVLRQQDYPNLSKTEPETLKGKDWLQHD